MSLNNYVDQINQAVNAAMKEWKKKYGEDEKLEDGDEFVTVFNDATLILGLEDSNIQVKFLLGQPFKVDMTLGISEEEE